MSKIAGCSKRTIEKWCREKYHLTSQYRMEHATINEKQKDLIIGSILGDGHIDKREKYPLFIVCHAENQKDYLYYKYNIMKNLCISPPRKYKGGLSKVVDKICMTQNYYRFCTRTCYALLKYREMSIIDVVKQLNEYSFSVWMLDDGHCNKKGYWQLCSPFDVETNNNILDILYDKFNIRGKLNNNDSRYIQFNAVQSRYISNMILDNIPNNMDIIKYKIFKSRKEDVNA